MVGIQKEQKEYKYIKIMEVVMQIRILSGIVTINGYIQMI